MRTTFKSNLTMLLLTATGVWLTVRFGYGNQWTAGWICGITAAMWTQQIVDHYDRHWRRKHGVRER